MPDITLINLNMLFMRYGEEIERERLGQSLREHWGIENGLHWVLDVVSGEDANRTREGNGAENLSVLRRLVLAMLKQTKGNKSIANAKY